MTAKSLLAALALCLPAVLAPQMALAQACPKTPATITCPEGQSWDAASMLCLPPSV